MCVEAPFEPYFMNSNKLRSAWKPLLNNYCSCNEKEVTSWLPGGQDMSLMKTSMIYNTDTRKITYLIGLPSPTSRWHDKTQRHQTLSA